MIIDIFIRTYKRDFQLLKCALYSILKYVTSCRYIIITVRNKEYIELTNSLKMKISDLDHNILNLPIYEDEIRKSIKNPRNKKYFRDISGPENLNPGSVFLSEK